LKSILRLRVLNDFIFIFDTAKAGYFLVQICR